MKTEEDGGDVATSQGDPRMVSRCQELGENPETESPSEPPEEPALPMPWVWTLGLQTCEKINSSCFKSLVCGALLWQPQ